MRNIREAKEISDADISITNLEQLLFALNQRLNHITKNYLSDKGLSMPRFWVLRRLKPEQAMTMGELQRRMLLAPATITGLVDALVQRGLVSRRRDEEDRRLVLLQLTPAGKELVDDALAYRASVLQSALYGQDVDAKLFIAYLDKIFQNLHKPNS